MKKIFFAASCLAFMAACSSNTNSEYDGYYDGNNATDSASGANISAAARQSDVDTSVNNIGTDRTPDAAADNYKKGENLIAMSDCMSCHKVDQKLVGPAYNDVADKYEFNDKNVDYLSQKIIKGGSGVWDQIPMTPHPDLSEEDAKEMAKYVLSLNK
ncbi:c-type cytochrome [Pontibacter silvestris]|uniref:C-type cytochrome n=1 Tax=Pontibacter silvestris TaxID=2305183 RepID=A0ABW4WZJ2_9BACT|nr:c-type cytochrome [Pontibacter silvestris]MCC9135219.1 c-type cytochrome [Pontibacter silvestris]